MTFVQTFGGDNINPSQLSFASYSISADLELSWPFEALSDSDPLAAKINVAATAAGLSIIFPDASVASKGEDALVKNTGAHTFSVKDNAGNTIGTVASGEAWYFYLIDNSSVAGTWDSVEFGAGTSSASAASLAGAGLEAVVTKLNQDLPVAPLPGDYSPGSGDRATVLRSTGGVVTYTPDPAADLGDGWFVYVVNAGSGTMTWDPDGAETIDGAATKVFQPDESAIVFCDGSNFWTVGYGRAITSTVTGVSISAAGTGAMTLSAAEVAAQVQNYTGALTGNRIVNFGTGVGYWFVFNNTSGAFTLTLRVNGADAGAAVAQGSYSIVRSDGTNLDVAFTATSGTVTNVATTSEMTGGPITTTGTLDLSNTGVAAGTYGAGLQFPSVTVTAKGRISAVSLVTLGSAAALTAGTAAGNVLVLDADALVPSVNGGASTGDIKFNVGTAAISGWVFANGTTIGNAASGATGRANADTEDLFTLLWNSWADAQAPVSGGRGVSAAADFAANKTITLPDLRGRALAALDTNGGAASAARLNSAISSTTPGAAGGFQTRTTTMSSTGSTSGSLSVSVGGQQNGDYSLLRGAEGTDGPLVPQNGATSTVTATGSTSGSLSVSASGTSASFITVQPTMVTSAYIKL